jgi:hypothetical protein
VLRRDRGLPGLKAPHALLLVEMEVADLHADLRKLDLLMGVVDPLVGKIRSAAGAPGGVDMLFVRGLQQLLLVALVAFLAAALSLLVFLLLVGLRLLALLEGAVRGRRLVRVG